MTEWNDFKVGGLYIDKSDTCYDNDNRELPDDEDGTPSPMLVVGIRLRRARQGVRQASVMFLWRGRTVTHVIPEVWTEQTAQGFGKYQEVV